MKKILILTTSTGEGHNQAANSISTTFEKSGYEIIRHDFLKSNSKLLTKLFITGYEISASFFPKTYGFAYKLTDTFFTNKLLSMVFSFTKRKILKLINETKPNIILVTHPFAVNIMGSLKRKGLKIPVIVIVTDFKAHSTYIDKNIDAYITASENTKEDLSLRGIDSRRIFSYGIPVKDEFFENKLNLENTKNDDYFNILLMSGSMGLKNISYVLKELLNNSNKLRITVVCGKNEKLKENLLKEYDHNIKNKKLHILGFCKDIDYLMEYSDIIISKPGGLTVTEAITKNLPLLIPFAIPGQETQNVEFLTKNGYALYIDNLLELNLIVDKLISNPKELEKMKLNLANLSSLYSKKEIVKLADKLVLKEF
ncbi:glycosyltransferase [Clostridium nigeriense]|uniref:MGDG synthase family glycosyltransferase n=1 Tax=Clostridium nigeriense TaxID=1805470 RepID=UPI0008325C19|nr:glycosyltransferase [Clostridium nigeriense]